MWATRLDGRVTVGAELGVGAFARVSVGRLAGSGQEVAIKMLRGSRRKSELMNKMMEREAQILQALADGPRLVRLTATGTLNRQRALIMELCDHGTVWEAVVRSGLIQPVRHYVGLPRAAVRALARDLCRALEYVHARQIIHADVKPENVFVRRGAAGYEYVLGDFGSATSLRPTRVHDYVQSRYYRAPEINLGRTHGTNVTPSIDVWSLGCIVFELLVGRPLFRAQDRTELARLHVRCLGLPPRGLLQCAKQPTLYTGFATESGELPIRRQWPSLQHAAARVAAQGSDGKGLDALPEAQARLLKQHLPASTVYADWMARYPKHAEALCWRLGQPAVDPQAHEFVAACVRYDRPAIKDLRVPYIQ